MADSILEKLNSLAERFCSLSTLVQGAHNLPSCSKTARRCLDPSASLVSHVVASPDESQVEEFRLPSVFEEIEGFGPDVSEVISQQINDTFYKKGMDSKLKQLYEKYKTPTNCKYLCVPTVNSELWHDLSKDSKSSDLDLQEL